MKRKYVFPEIKHDSYKSKELIANISINASEIGDEYYGEDDD